MRGVSCGSLVAFARVEVGMGGSIRVGKKWKRVRSAGFQFILAKVPR